MPAISQLFYASPRAGGHGLQDLMLCNLIERVCRHSNCRDMVFMVVDPWPDNPGRRLRGILEDISSFSYDILVPRTADRKGLTAEEYLAGISRSGDPPLPEYSPATRRRAWFKGWVEDLTPSEIKVGKPPSK